MAALLAALIYAPLLVGQIEKWLRTKSYGRALIYTILTYSVISLLISFLSVAYYGSRLYDKSVFDLAFQKDIVKYMFGIQFLSNYLVWLFVLLGTIIIMMVNDKYGPGVFRDFLLGKYFHPTREERIFMFIDLRNSTGIAEKLGEEKYFHFLKEVFKDSTPGIIYSHGEIYQYVGDEIVVSWKMDQGIQNANCIRSFFSIQQALKTNASKYQDMFGIVPEFKAGLHYGHVMTGELGVVKRDISFSGDVLNTTSRIQDQCNSLGVNILLSKYLVDRLEVIPELFAPKKIGNMHLRGKEEELTLYTV